MTGPVVGFSPRLFLLRHGQTTSNTIHALDTALPGADLTALGREQATEAGRRLAGMSERLMVVSSLAARAQQTATLAALAAADRGAELVAAGVPSARPTSDATARTLTSNPHLPLAMVPGVSEIRAGDMEMRNDEDAHQMYLHTLSSWLRGELELRVPGGQDGAEVLSAYLAELVELREAARVAGCDLVLVSHGAVIRLVAGFLGAVDPAWAFEAYLRNAQAVTVEGELGSGLGCESGRELGDEPSGAAASDDLRDRIVAGAWRELRGTMRITGWGDHEVPPLTMAPSRSQ